MNLELMFASELDYAHRMVEPGNVLPEESYWMGYVHGLLWAKKAMADDAANTAIWENAKAHPDEQLPDAHERMAEGHRLHAEELRRFLDRRRAGKVNSLIGGQKG